MAFTFTDTFCGCTDGQLADEVTTIGGIGEYDDYVRNQRIQHTLRLQKIHNSGPNCPNPVEKEVSVS